MKFIETAVFTKRLSGLLDDTSYAELQRLLTHNPNAGDLIEGTGGIRKSEWRPAVVVSVAAQGLFIITLRQPPKLRC